ncbi:hypothetical protein ALC60_14149 [Trachymyrmex zeteki]|uniref:Uncharacterized protein n=1 Tax=Mycetomoellerius zeteki TaxID=64791 RepID=A0A151WGC5_9HYME|nr:hypothetical protein ALC60_14149 [Trachymyrmex zeteki]
MKPNRSKRNESRRMESWPGLIAEVKHRMQLSPTSVFMHYMPFCSADHGRRGQSNIGKERHIYIKKLYAIFSYGVHVSYGILVQVNGVLSVEPLWVIVTKKYKVELKHFVTV